VHQENSLDTSYHERMSAKGSYETQTNAVNKIILITIPNREMTNKLI
jgi:hypothetical protein